jgi:hypothetical protein
MIKKLFLLLVVLTSLLADQSDTALPSWVFVPNASGKLAAVGSCPPHPKGEYMQRATALANARSALGQIIESQITVLREAAIQNDPSGEKSWNLEEIQLRSRALLEQSQQENAYVGSDGSLYLLLTLPKKAVSDNAEGSVGYTMNEIDNELSTEPFDPSALLRSGCYDDATIKAITTKSPMRGGKPVWFYNPHIANKPGAIGLSKKQPEGTFTKQKNLAWTLARADYAKQQKNITNTTLSKTTLNSDEAVIETASLSNTQSSSANVNRLVIKDEWMDPRNCDLYVWVY